MKISDKYIRASAIASIIACIGEFVTIFAFGTCYPGYSQLKDTMSALGATVSPVSAEISTWWIIMGILFTFFGLGFKSAFSDKGKWATLAAWLIILYGLGEGIGSGVFKADHTETGLTTSAIIHDIVGGIGVFAILLFPLVMLKVIPKNEMPAFHRFSQILFVTGILTVLLFLFRYSSDENNFLSVYKGLWQRLFMLNTYIYMVSVAVLVIRRRKKRVT